jgi:hypothetical protein
VGRVHGGDHDEGGQVVDNREREQEHPDAGGRAWGDERHRGEREGGVGRHRSAPAVAAGPPGVEGQVDDDRHGDPAHRGEHRDGQPAALAQLAEVELALGLESHDEEEQGHQALVDPGAQIGRDPGVTEVDRELRRPDGLVGMPPGRVRP